MCISSIPASSNFQNNVQQSNYIFIDKRKKTYQPFTPVHYSGFKKYTHDDLKQAALPYKRRPDKRKVMVDPPSSLIQIASQKQNGEINQDWLQKIFQKQDLSQITYIIKKKIQIKIKKMNLHTIFKLLLFFFSRISGKIQCSLIKSIIKQSFTTIAILQRQQDNILAQINNYDYLIYQNHPQNHYLYKQRQISKAFYYILKGQVKLEDQNKQTIFIKKQGQMIGSHQLLTHQLRKLSAICITEVSLLSISRKDFYTNLQQQILNKICQWSETIKNIYFFNSWDQTTTIKLIGKQCPSYYHFRHILYKQGQQSQQTFIVLQGQFKLTTKLKSGKTIQNHKIAPFCLGQQNLIQQSCRSSTAMVVSQRCKIIRLQRENLYKRAKAFNLQQKFQQVVNKVRQYCRLRKIDENKQNEKILRAISQKQLIKYTQDLRILTKDRVPKSIQNKQSQQQKDNDFLQTIGYNKVKKRKYQTKYNLKYFTPKKQRQFTDIQNQQRIFRRISLSRKKKRSSIHFNDLIKHIQNKQNNL